jgi:exonuclease III
MFNFPRVDKKKGGEIVVFVKSSLQATKPDVSFDATSFEFGLLNISIFNIMITIISLYRPPNPKSKDEFFVELENMLFCVIAASNHTIICGDFNIDLLDGIHSTKLVQLLQPYNTYPSIFLPTRETITSSTIIDNIFTSFHTIIKSGVRKKTSLIIILFLELK